MAAWGWDCNPISRETCRVARVYSLCHAQRAVGARPQLGRHLVLLLIMPTAQWLSHLKRPVSQIIVGLNPKSLVNASTPVITTLQQMHDQKLSFVMVCSDSGVFEAMDTNKDGVVDQNEVAAYGAAAPKLLGLFTEREAVHWACSGSGATAASTGDLMVATDSLMSIVPSETVGGALKLLNRGIFRHLPVLDSTTSSTVVGTLKLRDLLQPISSHRGCARTSQQPSTRLFCSHISTPRVRIAHARLC